MGLCTHLLSSINEVYSDLLLVGFGCYFMVLFILVTRFFFSSHFSFWFDSSVAEVLLILSRLCMIFVCLLAVRREKRLTADWYK